MFQKFPAQERAPIFFVLMFFLVCATVARTEVVVNPDGSATIGNVAMSDVYVAGNQIYDGPVASQASTTIDFNDLAPGEAVVSDRYITQGLIIEIDPSSMAYGSVIGSFIDGPCDGTRSLQTQPFTGPGFLLRFPNGVTSVALDAGDLGPSDSDVITVKAYSDDALETLVSIDIGFFPQGAPSGCVRLSVQANLIKAVEITSASLYDDGSSLTPNSYPNSIYIDNVTF